MPSPRANSSRRLGIPLIALALAALAFLIWTNFGERQAPGHADRPTRAARTAAGNDHAEEARSEEAKAEEAKGAGTAKRPRAARHQTAPESAEELAELQALEPPILRRMWWNRAKYYKPIGLEAEQRERMNARLVAHVRDRSSNNRQRDAFRDYRRALTDGDWETARARTEALGEAYTEPLVKQAEMMVDILMMLTPEQHQTLTRDFAGLLSGPWLLPRGLGKSDPTQRTHEPSDEPDGELGGELSGELGGELGDELGGEAGG